MLAEYERRKILEGDKHAANLARYLINHYGDEPFPQDEHKTIEPQLASFPKPKTIEEELQGTAVPDVAEYKIETREQALNAVQLQVDGIGKNLFRKLAREYRSGAIGRGVGDPFYRYEDYDRGVLIERVVHHIPGDLPDDPHVLLRFQSSQPLKQRDHHDYWSSSSIRNKWNALRGKKPTSEKYRPYNIEILVIPSFVISKELERNDLRGYAYPEDMYDHGSGMQKRTDTYVLEYGSDINPTDTASVLIKRSSQQHPAIIEEADMPSYSRFGVKVDLTTGTISRRLPPNFFIEFERPKTLLIGGVIVGDSVKRGTEYVEFVRELLAPLPPEVKP